MQPEISEKSTSLEVSCIAPTRQGDFHIQRLRPLAYLRGDSLFNTRSNTGQREKVRMRGHLKILCRDPATVRRNHQDTLYSSDR